MRLTRSDKARIVAAAGADGLASWARRVLLSAIGNEAGGKGEPVTSANAERPPQSMRVPLPRRG